MLTRDTEPRDSGPCAARPGLRGQEARWEGLARRGYLATGPSEPLLEARPGPPPCGDGGGEDAGLHLFWACSRCGLEMAQEADGGRGRVPAQPELGREPRGAAGCQPVQGQDTQSHQCGEEGAVGTAPPALPPPPAAAG